MKTEGDISMSDENEVYAALGRAKDENERAVLENQLFREVKKRAGRRVWNKVMEPCSDLVQEVMLAVFRKLPEFRGDSKLSTFVTSITGNKLKEFGRERVYWRRFFQQRPNLALDDDKGDQFDEVFIKPSDLQLRVHEAEEYYTRPILIGELCQNLSEEDKAVVRCKYEDMASIDAAQRLGVSIEAFDSRWARLKRSLRKKLTLARRERENSCN